MSQCSFITVLASTDTIVYCRLYCGVPARQFAWSAASSSDFALLNDEDFLFTEHGHGKLYGESLPEQLPGRCQSCCSRAAVGWLLSEWLLSEGCCQGFCQSGCCQSGCCQRASFRGLQSEWPLSEKCCQMASVREAAIGGLPSVWLLSESKSATKLLHSLVLVIYTAHNLPKWQNCDIIQMQPTTQQSKPGIPNPGPKRANPETQKNPETIEPTQKDK